MKMLLTLLSAIVIGWSLTLVGSCDPTQKGESGTASDTAKLAAYGKLIGTAFPPSTHLIRSKELHGLDDAVFVEIEMSTTEFSTWLQESPFAPKHIAATNRDPFHVWDAVLPEEWTKPRITNWQVGQVRLPNAKYLNILIDYDKVDKIRVFLNWFET